MYLVDLVANSHKSNKKKVKFDFSASFKIVPRFFWPRARKPLGNQQIIFIFNAYDPVVVSQLLTISTYCNSRCSCPPENSVSTRSPTWFALFRSKAEILTRDWTLCNDSYTQPKVRTGLLFVRYSLGNCSLPNDRPELIQEWTFLPVFTVTPSSKPFNK